MVAPPYVSLNSPLLENNLVNNITKINNNMNFNHLKTAMICLLAVCIQITHAGTQQVNIERSFMVGDGIAQFIPTGYDAKKIPSFALQSEPRKKGELASNFQNARTPACHAMGLLAL